MFRLCAKKAQQLVYSELLDFVVDGNQSNYYVGHSKQLRIFIRFRMSAREDSQSNYYVGHITQLTIFMSS